MFQYDKSCEFVKMSPVTHWKHDCNHETYIRLYLNPARPKETHGDPTRPQETHGDPARPKETHGEPGASLGTQGDPRKPRETQFGDPRRPKGRPKKTQLASGRPKETQGRQFGDLGRPKETQGQPSRSPCACWVLLVPPGPFFGGNPGRPRGSSPGPPELSGLS